MKNILIVTEKEKIKRKLDKYIRKKRIEQNLTITYACDIILDKNIPIFFNKELKDYKLYKEHKYNNFYIKTNEKHKEFLNNLLKNKKFDIILNACDPDDAGLMTFNHFIETFKYKNIQQELLCYYEDETDIINNIIKYLK